MDRKARTSFGTGHASPIGRAPGTRALAARFAQRNYKKNELEANGEQRTAEG